MLSHLWFRMIVSSKAMKPFVLLFYKWHCTTSFIYFRAKLSYTFINLSALRVMQWECDMCAA